MTYNATDVNVTCCNLDGTPVSVTCGQGLSCAASCFSLEATLCPSHNCEACDTFEDLTNEEEGQHRGWSYVTQASSALAFCPGPGHWCNVWRTKGCCFHPVCQRQKQKECSWLRYFVGRSSVKVQRLSFHDLLVGNSCPRPGDIQHGQWTCEEQQIPIAETANIGGELETYPGV